MLVRSSSGVFSMVNVTFANSVKWSYLGEFSARLAPPITMILAARFLSPSEFGIVAIALMAATFCQLFWEAGLSKALIQRSVDVEEALNFTFFFTYIIKNSIKHFPHLIKCWSYFAISFLVSCLYNIIYLLIQIFDI